MQIYVNKNQQQLGPYSPAEARDRIVSGQLTGADLAWHAGLTSWVSLSQILSSNPSHPTIGPISSTSPTETRSSGLAITSLVIAIIGAIAWVGVLIFAVVVQQHGGNTKSDNDPVVMLLGLVFLGTIGLNILGAIAGIVALVRGTGHKWMAITGLICNGLELLGVLALAALGMAMK